MEMLFKLQKKWTSCRIRQLCETVTKKWAMQTVVFGSGTYKSVLNSREYNYNNFKWVPYARGEHYNWIDIHTNGHNRWVDVLYLDIAPQLWYSAFQRCVVPKSILNSKFEFKMTRSEMALPKRRSSIGRKCGGKWGPSKTSRYFSTIRIVDTT